MARRSLFSVIFLTGLLRLASSLQVTPNSPCAAFCIDNSDLDRSDPNSSNTRGSDITCSDDSFNNDAKGQKFQRCLSCLQESPFEQGSENDQDWFLYNLRYSFDYCIFGYPNATGVGSNPCMTSEACGPLENALKEGILDPQHREQYGYCDVNGKAMLSDAVERCRSCVKADRSRSFISNFLVALEAGCEQQPTPGATIGLNDTIFTETTVQIVNPSASSAASSGIKLAATSIAAIVIGAVVFLLFTAGCIFMQLRKRTNRFNRQNRNRRVRASSLSFRCMTHLTPRESCFNPIDKEILMGEKFYMDPASAARTGPVAKDSVWNPKNAMNSLAAISTTTTVPNRSYIVSPKAASPDDYATPTSTTSVHSNAPLLYNRPSPYNPISSQYTRPPPPPPPPPPHTTFYASQERKPVIVRETKPIIPETKAVVVQWEEQRVAGARSLTRKKGTRDLHAAGEVRTIQMEFAPPPKKEIK